MKYILQKREVMGSRKKHAQDGKTTSQSHTLNSVNSDIVARLVTLYILFNTD